MYEAIIRLLEDVEGSRQLGARLRQRVVDCFSWEKTARQLLEAYGRAISRRDPKGFGKPLGSG